MATVPTVSAVATEEPAIAEKIAQPAMLVWASPPGTRMNRLEMPE